MGFYHIGGTRIASLAEGDVARAKIFELEPFNSDIVITTMSLKEIEEMIFNKFNDKVNYKESHRVDLIPSGLRYTIITNKAGDAVAVKLYPEVKKELYKVAVSNYVYENKTYNYTRRAEEGRTPLVTTYLIDRLAEGPYTPDNDHRGEMK
jgi:5'-nucleotidase